MGLTLLGAALLVLIIGLILIVAKVILWLAWPMLIVGGIVAVIAFLAGNGPRLRR